jgi:hypothetical protein
MPADGSHRRMPRSRSGSRVTGGLEGIVAMVEATEVAIPISAVTGFDGGIRLNITKKQVEELPPVG